MPERSLKLHMCVWGGGEGGSKKVLSKNLLAFPSLLTLQGQLLLKIQKTQEKAQNLLRVLVG